MDLTWIPGFDMYITYNLNYDWYYGTDGNTPSNQMDLMSVVLHEIGHGLNFSGSMNYYYSKLLQQSVGSWGYGTGYPNIYDLFMRDGSGTQLIDTSTYSNPSVVLADALISDNIWFHGDHAMAANGNQPVKIYAPEDLEIGIKLFSSGLYYIQRYVKRTDGLCHEPW